MDWYGGSPLPLMMMMNTWWW